MIRVTIDNLSGKTIYCNSKTEKLLNVLQENYIDWMHACGAKGRCTTCKAIILDGQDNIAPLSTNEERYASQNKLAINERLSCQAIVKGDIVIKVPEIYKLPHLSYSE